MRPKRSKFLGLDYKIEYVPDLVVDGDELNGLCKHVEETILIAENLSHHTERETILHEILHQIIGKGGFPLPAKWEEGLVTFLAGALIAHLKDNRALWRFLLEKDPGKQTDTPPPGP